MPEERGEEMDLSKQLRDQGITWAFLSAIIFSAAMIFFKVGDVSEDLEKTTKSLTDDIAAVESKVGISQRDISEIKMDVNGLQIGQRSTDKDLDQLRTENQLVRSQLILTGRNIRDIKREVTGTPGRAIIPMNGAANYTFEERTD